MHPDKVGLSVSHTSRSPRPGEIDGVHYHFVSKDFMRNKIDKNLKAPEQNGRFFLEHAEVHGNIYGTSFDAIKHVQSQNKICILDIDVKGVKSIKHLSQEIQSDSRERTGSLILNVLCYEPDVVLHLLAVCR